MAASKVKHCWLCSNSHGGTPRAIVTCHFRLGTPGAFPIVMPDWAWEAIRDANTEVHESAAQECEAYDPRSDFVEAYERSLQKEVTDNG